MNQSQAVTPDEFSISISEDPTRRSARIQYSSLSVDEGNCVGAVFDQCPKALFAMVVRARPCGNLVCFLGKVIPDPEDRSFPRGHGRPSRPDASFHETSDI